MKSAWVKLADSFKQYIVLPARCSRCGGPMVVTTWRLQERDYSQNTGAKLLPWLEVKWGCAAEARGWLCRLGLWFDSWWDAEIVNPPTGEPDRGVYEYRGEDAWMLRPLTRPLPSCVGITKRLIQQEGRA